MDWHGDRRNKSPLWPASVGIHGLGRKTLGPFEHRFWSDTVLYEPGELKVVAYRQGKEWAVGVKRTAGTITLRTESEGFEEARVAIRAETAR